MPVPIGTKLGTYEVAGHIGSGGMGEVYQAHDTKLGRDVAIKVLPDRFARDSERLARFQREAKLLAALNHPNIATIHGLEQSGDTHYLVMELVPGDTLRDRILRDGALPVTEALNIAKQIAEALEAAHNSEKAIIHRDLKPANVKVTPEDRVKVLDFGLAKAFTAEPSAEDVAHSPTLSMNATAQGVIMGTAAYMSPEQAKGKTVNKATDIFAFGSVLYEILTGKQAFQGEDVAEILSAVIRAEPDWGFLPESTPPAIRTLLRRCLRKDRHQRLQDAASLRIEIEDVLSGAASDIAASPPAVLLPAQPVWKRTLPWALVAAMTIIAALIFWRPWTPAPAVPVVARFALPLQPKEVLNPANGGLAISPDGRYLAYSGARSGGARQLFLRPMDSAEAVPIPGTENASGIFFSPDSQWIGFTADVKLKKAPVAGGTPIVLCEHLSFSTGSWAPDGSIFFVNGDGKLMRVTAAGGAPQVVTTFEIKPGEQGPRWLEVLPGGDAILVVNGGTAAAFSDDSTIIALSLKTGQQKSLIQGGTSPHYLSAGRLVYAQGGRLLAVPFDPRRLEVTGVATPILEDVWQGTAGYSAYALSGNGSVAYVNGGEAGGRPRVAMQWVDSKGIESPLRGDKHAFAFPNLSPDGRLLAIRNGDTIPGYDIWISDLARATLTRLTFAKAGEQATVAIWTPDAKRLIYALSAGAGIKLMWRPADGTGAEEELFSANDLLFPLSVSPDGQSLVFNSRRQGHFDLWLLPLTGDRKARPLIENTFNKVAAQISPDGRWLAYASDESKRQEVYVQPFPGLGGKWQISTMGGSEPRWSHDGRRLFYRTGTKMMAVNIQVSGVFTAGTPRMLFDQVYSTVPGVLTDYDVAADGRFLMLKEDEVQTSQLELRVVLNWAEEIRRRVPAGTK